MRRYIKDVTISIYQIGNIWEVSSTDKFGRTIKARTCFDRQDADRVFNLFCKDAIN